MPTLTFTKNPTAWAATLLGRIDGCTNPESAELLPDGEHFVFGNCALTLGHPAYRAGQGIVYLQGEAFVSRGRIGPGRKVTLEERALVTGLTATLGCDVLPLATSRLPAGTVLMAEGGRPVTQAGATELQPDAAVRPRVLAFDPASGRVLGSIALNAASPIGRRFNGLDQPNGLGVDAQGNLYVGDIPNSNPVDTLPAPVPSAVYRIPHAALDALLQDTPGSADAVQRIEVPGFVNGITVSPLDGKVYFVSCSFHDPVGGGIYCAGAEDFACGFLPPPLVTGLGIQDGVGVTRRGTVLSSTPITGEIHAFTAEGVHHVIQVGGANIVRMPADFNVCYPSALSGEPALLVTDISVGMAKGDASVAVVDISGL